MWIVSYQKGKKKTLAVIQVAKEILLDSFIPFRLFRFFFLAVGLDAITNECAVRVRGM